MKAVLQADPLFYHQLNISTDNPKTVTLMPAKGDSKMKKYLASILVTSLLTIILYNPAFAHCVHCDSITVIHGEPVLDFKLPSVQIKTHHGFEEPIMGETDEDEILYNIPIDGSDPVPLRQVATLYLTDGDSPVVIDESISVDNITRGLVYPGSPNPITIADWINGGDSWLRIKVLKNGMSKVKMKIRGLLPNSLYGVWQFNQAGGPPGPWGGIPNIFITDARGNATMKRTLPFNINEVVDNLLIAYHSDHRVYGGTPSLVRPRGGPDLHFQLIFDVKNAQ